MPDRIGHPSWRLITLSQRFSISDDVVQLEGVLHEAASSLQVCSALVGQAGFFILRSIK